VSMTGMFDPARPRRPARRAGDLGKQRPQHGRPLAGDLAASPQPRRGRPLRAPCTQKPLLGDTQGTTTVRRISKHEQCFMGDRPATRSQHRWVDDRNPELDPVLSRSGCWHCDLDRWSGSSPHRHASCVRHRVISLRPDHFGINFLSRCSLTVDASERVE